MKKIRLLLAIILTSVCSIQGMWAERTAPEIPIHTNIVSGQTYYLYNVAEKQFVYDNGGYLYISSSKLLGLDVIAADSEGSKYVLRKAGTGDQYAEWSQYSSYSDSFIKFTTTETTPTYESAQFVITQSDNGYLIRNVHYTDRYLGKHNNSSSVAPNVASTSSNAVWLLLNQLQAVRLALYNALQLADTYSIDVTEYDAVYSNPSSAGDALFDALSHVSNHIALMKDYVVPEWSEVPLRFDEEYDGQWSYGSSSGFSANVDKQETATLSAYLTADKATTVVYNVKSGYADYSSKISYGYFDIFVDGVLYESLNPNMTIGYNRNFIELPAGEHTIQWQVHNTSGDRQQFWVSGIGVLCSPTVTVSLSEPGSLGTEVLSTSGVASVKDVRKLVVKGPMNDDDWERISMMTYLCNLDLSNAECKTLPDSRFFDSNQFLYTVKLPKNLEAIGYRAFYDSNLKRVAFPATLKTIASEAFEGCDIKEALLPEGVTSIGSEAFYNCYNLTTVSYPSTTSTIPYLCFASCPSLQPFDIPEGVSVIGESAFSGASCFSTTFPATLTKIGRRAFSETAIETAELHSGITSIGESAFSSSKVRTAVLPEGATLGASVFDACKELERIEFPTSFSLINYDQVSSCPALKDIVFKSPSMVTGSNSFLSGARSDVTIHVPSYLRTAYMLDPYWYNYEIVGFSTSEISDWTISQPVTLNTHDRLDGTPDISLIEAGAIKINGDAAQPINNLSSRWDIRNSSGPRTMVLANGDNVSVAGTLENRLYTRSKVWDFVSLPFDVRVGDIDWQGKQAAVRYYDGAARAANGTGASWKNYGEDDVIPAGTGFIIQTSAEGWNSFTSLDNASKQNIVSNAEFVTTLAANASEVAANKGWNLVGNPWQTWYNIHKLNFTAPITVWNGNNRTYEAYSIQDDDYALAPNQAFFVQCPDEVTSIGFPTSGRQLTYEITDQNGIKARYPQTAARQLIDITLAQGDFTDRTRVVVNAEATLGFEMTRDAQKMRSMDSTVPQLFTVADGMELSINERPLADGIVDLGFYAPQGGVFTIAAVRCQAESVVLEDLISGLRTDLTQDEYNFTADAGTATRRFRLHIQANDVSTDINVLETDSGTNRNDDWYDLSGRRATVGQKGIVVRNGKKMLK